MRHRAHFVLRGLDAPTHPRRCRRNRSGNRLRPRCCRCVSVAAQRKWCGPAQRCTNAAVLDLGLAHLLTLVPTVPHRHRRALAARMATQLDLRLSYPPLPAAGRLPELRCAATLPPTHLHDPRVGPMCSTDPRPPRAAAALRRRPDPRSASRSPPEPLDGADPAAHQRAARGTTKPAPRVRRTSTDTTRHAHGFEDPCSLRLHTSRRRRGLSAGLRHRCCRQPRPQQPRTKHRPTHDALRRAHRKCQHPCRGGTGRARPDRRAAPAR